MNIEGAEIDALKELRKTIVSEQPNLAICVYHKVDDIITIPELILSYVPTYNIALRHYSFNQAETVMYFYQ